jgi:hypothetical protein
MKEWLLERLKEPSTYKGISLFFASVGITVAPELINTILAALGILIGAIEMVRKENANGL